MASPESLIKYYECLKESFNKIQDKNNKTALVNAALRPKICEEFAKSQEVLVSYLNYIQVFSLIYSDKFITICSNIIVPLFKENDIPKHSNNNISSDVEEKSCQRATKLHETINAIIEYKPGLANDFAICIMKSFPSLSVSGECNDEFKKYLRNCLKVCTYLHGEPLITLVNKIFERLCPPHLSEDEENTQRKDDLLGLLYEILYDFLDDLNQKDRRRIYETMLHCFTQEFIAPPWFDRLNYLILYICSSSDGMIDLFHDMTWKVFIDQNRSTEERTASVAYLSSVLARSKLVDLEKALGYIESTRTWCHEFLDIQHDEIPTVDGNENSDAFRAAVISICYLITQRFREMYESETIQRLVGLDLDKLIDNSLKPLDYANKQVRERFTEVAALYHIAKFIEKESPSIKRRKSYYEANPADWTVPFAENQESVPERLRPIYRGYYHHRNFTVFRE